MDRILILDFGGQTTQLIGRRIRELGVYSDIMPGDGALSGVIADETVKGVILSGSPHAAWDKSSPEPDPVLWDSGLPILGICYGFYRIVLRYGGKVKARPEQEYGRSTVMRRGDDPLFENVPSRFVSWMSHGDSVYALGENFEQSAESENGLIAAAVHKTKPIWGLQYHPEADHCEFGDTVLENFARGICGAKVQWNLEHYVDKMVAELHEKSAGRDVLLLVSGGVDSTVTAALLLRSVPAERLHLMYVDTGLMRLNESEEVAGTLKKLGAGNLVMVDARGRFLDALAGVEDPEEKRRIIGDTFIRVQDEEIGKHLGGNYLLAQGTLYTDLIESGRGVGTKAGVIKSHHNVGSPLVQAKRAAGELLEPLERLYKDEVRRLGGLLGLDEAVIHRHPFPGPGLAVRILSEITEDDLRLLREADAVYIRELKARGLYHKIWQAFAVLLPLRSVGTTGDARDYGRVLALRAVVSRDGMTADVFDFPAKDLLEISAKITNTIRGIGRVVYDVSSKPPATVEWE